MSSLGTLVPKRACFVLCKKASSLLRSDTYRFLVVLWFNITHISHTKLHSETTRLTHPYKYILTPLVMWSQQLSTLHWIIHWYQKVMFHDVFSFQKLLICSSRIEDTDTSNTYGKEGGLSYEYELGCFWTFNFCFLTVQKKQVMTSPLFWTWDFSLNKNQLFLRKYFMPTSSKLRRFHWMCLTF